MGCLLVPDCYFDSIQEWAEMSKNGQAKTNNIINNKFLKNLLLCTTAMTALMFASSPSMAANECGPAIVNGAVTCSGAGGTDSSPYANGISYNINGQTLNVNGALLVINSGVNDGVSLTGGTSNNSTINVVAGTSITTSGANAEGIFSQNIGGAGNISIISGANIMTSGSGASGIGGEHSGAGNISIVTNNGGITTNNTFAAGISAAHTGTGSVTISSPIDIFASAIGAAGLGSHGIIGRIANNANSSELLINATGGAIRLLGDGSDGIFGSTTGLGSVTINSAATIKLEGLNGSGIFGEISNASSAADLKINTTGGTIETTKDTSFGIRAINSGKGKILVNSAVDITTAGVNAAGIRAETGVNANIANTEIVASAGRIKTTGNTSAAIHVLQRNAGSASVTSAADIQTTGNNSSGIEVSLSGSGAIIVNSTGTIATMGTGGGHGIAATRSAVPGYTYVTVSGVVTSASGDGIHTEGQANDISSITLNSGANVSASNGSFSAIYNDEGNSTVTVNTGAIVNGFVRLGNGSDSLAFNATSLANLAVIDGGDDTSTADGFTDTLTFANSSGTLTGAWVTNWERIDLTFGSVISFTDTALTAGLVTVSNATFNAGANFGLIADLTLNAGGLFTSAGGGAGVFAIVGVTNNGGTISLQDGAAGDRLTFEGAYTGNNGTIKIDTVLGGDGSATDLITANNGTAGTTTLNVKNAGGTGAATVAGIKVIAMGGGAPNGAFVLAGDHLTPDGKQAIVGGAYSYRLVKQSSGDWHLVSSLTPVTVTPTTPTVTPTTPATPLYQPGSPIYEAYPQILQTMNVSQSYYQRLGSRYSRFDNSEPQLGDGTTAASSTNGDTREGQRGPFWGKISGQYAHVEPSLSTTSSRYNIRSGNMQVGIDMLANENAGGNLFFGITGQYGFANADVSSIFGNGKVNAKNYGFGITSTWITQSGFYLDGQAHFNWFDTDLSSDTLGLLVNNNTAYGQSWSLEAGMPIETGTGWMITPQAQLSYSNIRFKQFIGRSSELVSLNDGNSLIGRAGFSLARDTSWTGDDGSISRGHFYGIANVYNQFENGTETVVSGVSLFDRRDRLSGEIGLGFNVSWAQEKFSLYGDVKTSTSLENTGNSYAYGGTIGFKARF